MIDNFAYGVLHPFIVGALVAESAPEGAQAPILIGAGLLSGALAIGLFAVTVRWWLQYGQSPGKRVLDLRIVHMDGRQAGVSELVYLRWGATFAINMALAVCGVNSIFNLVDQLMVFSAGNQTLHDRIAKTVVVDAHYVPPGMELWRWQRPRAAPMDGPDRRAGTPAGGPRPRPRWRWRTRGCW